MDELTFLLPGKLVDWPTIVCGLCFGLAAWSWWAVLPMAVVAGLAAEIVLMFARGWPFQLTLFAVGAIAALPWVMLGFAVRSFAMRALHR